MVQPYERVEIRLVGFAMANPLQFKRATPYDAPSPKD